MNKKVSQLSATTESNDNVWIVMNNSGNTETFRIKREDFLSGTTTPPGLVSGTGTDSIKSSDSLTTTPSTASGDSNVALGNGADASGIGGVAIGKNAKANSGDYNIHISNGNVGASIMGSRSIWLGGGNIFNGEQHISIGYSTYHQGSTRQISIGHETGNQGISSIAIGNDYNGANRAAANYAITLGNGNTTNNRIESVIVGNRNTINGGERNYILGNLSNISSTGGYNTILGCYDTDITGTTNNVVLIGLNGFTSPTESNTTYVDKFISLNTASIGTGNTINSNIKNSLIVGYGNNITSTQNKQHFILGHSNTISSVVGGNPTNVVVGNNNTASAYGAWVVGGFSLASGERSFRWGNNGSATATESFSWGEQVLVSGLRSLGFGDYSTIQTNYSYVFGNDNDITGSGSLFQGIWGGSGNRITSSAAHNTILGGLGNTISGTSENVVLLGLNGFVSPTENNTTYTQNHASLGQTYNGYYDNLSGGTFTIDWNNGNTQKLFMTSDITLDFTNVKSGATYKLAVENGGTHNITSVSASGFTILCEGGSIPNITNNGKDLCVLEVIGTEIYVRHFSNFSVPV